MLKLFIIILVSTQSLTPSGGQETPIITQADWEWLASRTDIKRPNHFTSTNGDKQPNVPTPSSVNIERPNNDYNINIDNLGHVETPKVPLAEWTLFAASHAGNLKTQNNGTSFNVRNVAVEENSTVNQQNFMLPNHSINSNVESLNSGKTPLVQLTQFVSQTNQEDFRHQLVSANLINHEHTTGAHIASGEYTKRSIVQQRGASAPSADSRYSVDFQSQRRNIIHRQHQTTAPAESRIMPNKIDRQNGFNIPSAVNHSQTKLASNTQSGYMNPTNQSNIQAQNTGNRFYTNSWSQEPRPYPTPGTNKVFATQTNNEFNTRFNTSATTNLTGEQTPLAPFTESRANQGNFVNQTRANNSQVSIRPYGHTSTATQFAPETPVSNRTLHRLYIVNTPSIDIPHDNDTAIVKEIQIPEGHMRARLNCRCVINGRCASREYCDDD